MAIVFEKDRKRTVRGRSFDDNVSSNEDFFFSSHDN